MSLASYLFLWAFKGVLVCAFAVPLASFLRSKPATSLALLWRCVFLVLATVPLWSITGLGWKSQAPTGPALSHVVSPITYTQRYVHLGKDPIALPDGGTAYPETLVVEKEKAPAFQAQDFVAIYLIGLAYCLLRMAFSAGKALQLYRSARPDVHPRFEELCRRAGVSGVELRSLDEGDLTYGPMTFGFPRPCVLVPRSLWTWSPEAQEVALLHELAHIRRGDWIAHLFAWCVSCLYWFNPLCWYGFKSLRGWAERACDDEVLELGVTPTLYAEELLRIARMLRDRRGPCFAVPMAERPEVEGRIAAILDGRRRRIRWNPAVVRASAFNALVLSLPLATFSAFRSVDVVPNPFAHQPANPYLQGERERPIVVEETARIPNHLLYADGDHVTFSDGTSVRLVGISDVNSQLASDFWTPSGGPIKAFRESNYSSWRSIAEGGEFVRYFAFDVKSSKRAPCSFVAASEIKPGLVGKNSLDSYPSDSPNSDQSRFIFGLDLGEGRNGVFCVIGHVPYRKMATVAAPQPTRPSSVGPNIVVSFRGKFARVAGEQGEPKGWSEDLFQDIQNVGEVRIVGRNSRGAQVWSFGPILEASQYASDAWQGYTIPVGTYAKIATLDLEVRPVDWVKFDRMKLDPDFNRLGRITWGPAVSGARYPIGDAQVEAEGLAFYQRVRGVWRPKAFVSPSGENWAGYPRKEDRMLSPDANWTAPVTVMASVTGPMQGSGVATLRSQFSVDGGPWQDGQDTDGWESNGDYYRAKVRASFDVKRYNVPIRVRILLAQDEWTVQARKSIDLRKYESPSLDVQTFPLVGIVTRDSKGVEHVDPLGVPVPKSDLRVVLSTPSGALIKTSSAGTTFQSGKRISEVRQFGIETKELTDGGHEIAVKDANEVLLQTRPFVLVREFAAPPVR